MKVLDKGSIELIEVFGNDFTPVEAARISFGNGRKTEEEDIRLLRYLIKNRHTSPFEQVVLRWKVKAPIFVFREWHRHRTASLNEMSGRYTELKREFYQPASWRVRDPNNKQGSIEIGPGHWDNHDWSYEYNIVCNQSFDLYESMLQHGVAKEQARMCLPVSTYSQMIWTNDLHNTWHFLTLRDAPNAQWEIRQYAQVMIELMEEKLPVLMGLWKESR